MTTNHLLITKIDTDVEKGRALAKVYALLIRLAEEAEKKSDESTLTQMDPSTDEANSMTLQQNIPP